MTATSLTPEELKMIGCTCWSVVPGMPRHAAVYAGGAVERMLAARTDHRLALLSAVVSYDAVNQSDLPLPLLDSIRAEVQGGAS